MDDSRLPKGGHHNGKDINILVVGVKGVGKSGNFLAHDNYILKNVHVDNKLWWFFLVIKLFFRSNVHYIKFLKYVSQNI